MNTLSHKQRRGFTVLFAVLVASLLLAVGLVIFDITFKEVSFSIVTRDSNFAIYAADSGIECALYWDLKYGGAGTAFATSSASSQPSSGIVCNGQDIAASPWSVTKAAAAATTTFQITFSPQPYCVNVTVAKHGSPIATTIVARGYNTCATGNSNRIERALQADY